MGQAVRNQETVDKLSKIWEPSMRRTDMGCGKSSMPRPFSGQVNVSAKRWAEIFPPKIDKPTIGIVCLATAGYYDFVARFVQSARLHLLPGYEKKFYILTDHAGDDSEDMLHCRTEHRPWPQIMVDRYRMVLEHEAEYDCDYIIHQDIDMRYVATVGDEVISPDWFVTRSPLGEDWATGSLLGGQREHFLRILAMIQHQIDHGELHEEMPEEWYLNRQIGVAGCFPSVKLGVEYCCPERTNMVGNPKILTLNTGLKLSLDKLKNTSSTMPIADRNGLSHIKPPFIPAHYRRSTE